MEQKKNPVTERKLVVSVILRAIKDYIDGRNSYKIDRLLARGRSNEISRLERNFRSARFWIFEEKNTEYIFSFEKCCEVIAVSPQRIRRGLNQLIHTDCQTPVNNNMHHPVS